MVILGGPSPGLMSFDVQASTMAGCAGVLACPWLA